MLYFGAFRFDPSTQMVWRGTERIQLRTKTFFVLKHLVENPHRLVEQEELRQAVWAGTAVSAGVLRGYVREVRSALGDDAEAPRYIETVAGRGYRFVAEVTRKPIGRAAPAPLVPARTELVARDVELAILRRWLRGAADYRRQFILISGEAGIGKSALLEIALASSVAGGEELVGTGQCLELGDATDRYSPLLEALEKLCRGRHGHEAVEAFARLAPTWLAHMTGVTPDRSLARLRRNARDSSPGRMMRELADVLEGLSGTRPVVLALEDLQWIDRGSVDMLSFVTRRTEAARLAILGTYRAEEVVPATHPVRRLIEELRAHGQCEALSLGPLELGAAREYVDRRFPGAGLPAELPNEVWRLGEGNPLFMSAVLDDLVERGRVTPEDGGWRFHAALPSEVERVPERLLALIDGTLGRLSDRERRTFEASSVLGPEFAAAAVAAALGEETQDIEEICEALTRRRLLARSGSPSLRDGGTHSRYVICHTFHREVALDRVSATLRRQWQRRAVARLEGGDPLTRAAVGHMEGGL